MSRSAIIGLLVALNVWAIGCSLKPLYIGLSDRSPFLHAITEPEEWIRPWGPPLLLGVLFAMLGSRRTSRMIARFGAAFALYGALYWVMIGYAFTGFFVMMSEDWGIVGGFLIVATLLGWWGFSRDGESEPADAPG